MINRGCVEERKKLGEEDPGNVADEEDSLDSTDFQDLCDPFGYPY